MKDDELANESPPVVGPTPYELLVRQSRKMGKAATKTLHDLKHLLHQEIPMPSRDQLLSGLSLVPRLKNTKKTQELDSLKRMVRKSHEILAGARTVFLVKLFPDDIIIDRTKITITKRSFFWSSSVVSIRVEDILNVSTEVGPLFGSVSIASRVMNSIDHFQISYLWRGDAIYIKHIIQGYVFALQNNVDVSKLPRKELLDMLNELGHS